jgi:hypothetical protein
MVPQSGGMNQAVVPAGTTAMIDLGAKMEYLRQKRDEMEVHLKDRNKAASTLLQSGGADRTPSKAQESELSSPALLAGGSNQMVPFRNTPRSAARVLPRGYQRSLSMTSPAVDRTGVGAGRSPTASVAGAGAGVSGASTSRSNVGLLSPVALKSRNTLKLVIGQSPMASSSSDPTADLPLPPQAMQSLNSSAYAAVSAVNSPMQIPVSNMGTPYPMSASRADITNANMSISTPHFNLASPPAPSSAAAGNKENKATPNVISSVPTPSSTNTTAGNLSMATPQFINRREDRVQEYEDDEEEPASVIKPSNGAPVLTMVGYDTTPSRHVLEEMSAAELAKVVQFRIYRPGIGEICWPGETDVRHLNLDEIVRIEPKEVFVYDGLSDDDPQKPPQGRGLNKHAIITLWNMYPKSKHLTEEKVAAYEAKLHKACEAAGAQFQEYNPHTGEWIFAVDHFSRYGLADSDSDEESAPAGPRIAHSKAASVATPGVSKRTAAPPSTLKNLSLKSSLDIDANFFQRMRENGNQSVPAPGSVGRSATKAGLEKLVGESPFVPAMDVEAVSAGPETQDTSAQAPFSRGTVVV